MPAAVSEQKAELNEPELITLVSEKPTRMILVMFWKPEPTAERPARCTIEYQVAVPYEESPRASWPKSTSGQI